MTEKEYIIYLYQKGKFNYREIANMVNDKFNTIYWDSERVRDRIRKYRKKVEKPITKTRILHISDNHYPFNLPKEIFKDYVGKIDVLVFGGDEQDCQSISKFRKKYRVPFVDEMIGTRQMIIDIVEYIKPKRVLLNKGNHNERLINYFSDKIHEDLLTLMPETNLDFIIDIGFWKYDHQNKCKTFYEPLTKVFRDKIDIEYSKNWYCKVGKTIFAHPKAYKSGILGTTEKAYTYFLQIGEQFDTLCLSHTHHQGFTRYGKCYMFESGALCEEPSYASEGKMTRPQDKGFVYLEQDEDGKLIYDMCKIVCLN